MGKESLNELLGQFVDQVGAKLLSKNLSQYGFEGFRRVSFEVVTDIIGRQAITEEQQAAFDAKMEDLSNRVVEDIKQAAREAFGSDNVVELSEVEAIINAATETEKAE